MTQVHDSIDVALDVLANQPRRPSARAVELLIETTVVAAASRTANGEQPLLAWRVLRHRSRRSSMTGGTIRRFPPTSLAAAPAGRGGRAVLRRQRNVVPTVQSWAWLKRRAHYQLTPLARLMALFESPQVSLFSWPNLLR
ncbi:hypothetical protein ABZ070_32705 [Streptomyces sp. NPDC006283]|uniref:hypothetical protein n=1 Tax=Streptomyces sp. NPDC006283 TaxID=3156741 RepID=UPI0033B91F90